MHIYHSKQGTCLADKIRCPERSWHCYRLNHISSNVYSSCCEQEVAFPVSKRKTREMPRKWRIRTFCSASLFCLACDERPSWLLLELWGLWVNHTKQNGDRGTQISFCIDSHSAMPFDRHLLFCLVFYLYKDCIDEAGNWTYVSRWTRWRAFLLNSSSN